MKIQTKPARVLEKFTSYLQNGVHVSEPAWYKVVARHPPLHDYTWKPQELKPPEVKTHYGLYQTRVKPSRSKKLDIYRPRKIASVERQLRDLFYRQHPWELARSRMVLEVDGRDNLREDWSSIKQVSKPLDGESVVRRTMWLLENSDKVGEMTMVEAYDKARFEFYRVRMEEELEAQVAVEENEMFGSIYYKTPVDKGLEIEQQFLEKWKEEAYEMSEAARAKTGDVSEASYEIGGEAKPAEEAEEAGADKAL